MLSCLKMAWSSLGEETREVIKNYVHELTLEQKVHLQKAYDWSMFPRNGEWETLQDVTFITLRNRDQVLQNLGLAILKEAFDLGARKYCIIRSYNRDFESFMILILHYLPRDKFCMYPKDEFLSGSFFACSLGCHWT